MPKRAYRKQCLQCDKWYTTTVKTEDTMFCSNECAAEYRVLIDKISIPKQVEEQILSAEQQFTPEYAHDIHMLLHDMVDVIVKLDGFVTIKYFPHMNEEVRLAYGVAAKVEEQIL